MKTLMKKSPDEEDQDAYESVRLDRLLFVSYIHVHVLTMFVQQSKVLLTTHTWQCLNRMIVVGGQG